MPYMVAGPLHEGSLEVKSRLQNREGGNRDLVMGF